MAKFNFIQNSFTAGEITPRLQGRTDLQQYSNAAKTIKNGVVHSSGGVSRRGGTRFIDNVGYCRLIPFTISTSESYIVAITGSTIYVYNVAQPNVKVTIAGSLNSTESSNNIFGGYSNSTTLERIQYMQIGDNLYLVHPDHQPLVIQRTSTNSFFLKLWTDVITVADSGAAGFNRYERWPYRAVNTASATTVSLNTTTPGAAKMTSSAALFDSGMVDSYWKVDISGTEVYFYIDTFNNDQDVDGILYENPTGTGPTSDWYESAWSDFRGWPRTVSYDFERIIFGGNSDEPDKLWFSQVGNFIVFETPTSGATNNSAFDSAIGSSNQVNEIQWASKGKSFVVGTAGAEYIVNPSDPTLGIGPDNLPVFEADTSHGSEYVQPVRYEGALSFIQRSGLKILELAFDFNEQSFRTDNLSLLGDHVIKERYETQGASDSFQKFVNIQQTNSNGVIWAIDDSFGLYGITRDRGNRVVAWHTHDIAGNTLDSDSNPTLKAKVRSIAAVPGQGDELWMLVQRYIDGSTEYYIESMVDEYIDTDLSEPTILFQRKTPYFSDSSLLLLNDTTFTVQDSGVDTGADTLEVDTNLFANITDGVLVTYTSDGGSPITGLTVGNDYYVVNSTLTLENDFSSSISGTIQLESAVGGGAINLTGAGTGPHTFTLASTSTIFGRLEHLEGEEVAIVADGSWVGTKTVSSGQITLDNAATNAVIGLNYNTNIITLPVEAGGQFGTAQGMIKRIDELIFRFYRTIGAKHGRSEDTLESLVFRPSDLAMNEPIPMFTGDKNIEMVGNWDRLGQVYIRQDLPLPFTLSSLVMRGVTNDG